jgi:monoterpene epsilon-lactone hydrolase
MTAKTSEIYQTILATLDGELTLPDDNLSTAKAKMEALHGHPIAAETDAEWIDYGDIRCALVTANTVSRPDRILVYLRGGAYIAAAGDGFLFYAEMLSRLMDARVLMVDYSLAPQHQFPTQLDECCYAFSGLLESGIEASKTALIGDSCGGGLVLTTLMKLRDKKLPLPACAISLSGWLDLAAKNDNCDPLYRQAYTRKRGLDYAGSESLEHPLISPVYGNFAELPPLLLQAGGIDPTSEYAQRAHSLACEAGVNATLDIAANMVHGFQGLANLEVPESLAAFGRAKLFFDLHCR